MEPIKNAKNRPCTRGWTRDEKAWSRNRQKNEYYIEEIKMAELLTSFTRYCESFLRREDDSKDREQLVIQD